MTRRPYPRILKFPQRLAAEYVSEHAPSSFGTDWADTACDIAGQDLGSVVEWQVRDCVSEAIWEALQRELSNDRKT